MVKEFKKPDGTPQIGQTLNSGENKQNNIKQEIGSIVLVTLTSEQQVESKLSPEVLRQKKMDLMYHCLAPGRVPDTIPFPELSMYAEEFAKVSKAAKEAFNTGNDKEYCEIFQKFYDLVMKE